MSKNKDFTMGFKNTGGGSRVLRANSTGRLWWQEIIHNALLLSLWGPPRV